MPIERVICFPHKGSSKCSWLDTKCTRRYWFWEYLCAGSGIFQCFISRKWRLSFPEHFHTRWAITRAIASIRISHYIKKMNTVSVRIDLNPNEKLSVIFYIHGGAFIMGSSNEFYGPDFLIEQRVIVVSFTLWISALETILIWSFDAIISGDDQLSCRCFWVFVTGITWIFWQYGPKRSTNGTQMDSQKYSSLWWRQ